MYLEHAHPAFLTTIVVLVFEPFNYQFLKNKSTTIKETIFKQKYISLTFFIKKIIKIDIPSYFVALVRGLYDSSMRFLDYASFTLQISNPVRNTVLREHCSRVDRYLLKNEQSINLLLYAYRRKRYMNSINRNIYCKVQCSMLILYLVLSSMTSFLSIIFG